VKTTSERPQSGTADPVTVIIKWFLIALQAADSKKKNQGGTAGKAYSSLMYPLGYVRDFSFSICNKYATASEQLCTFANILRRKNK